MAAEKSTWWIYKGNGEPHNDIVKLPEPPSWRQFSENAQQEKGEHFKLHDSHAIDLVNTALYLRRPLLVTGKPGTGKTSLAYSVAYELQLGKVLRWSITTRSTLHEGLYQYDAIARLQDASLQKTTGEAREEGTQHDDAEPPDIGRYLRLGPLGTAFTAQKRPYVLLIDEIDKSDIDLPNDLLHIFEEGEFLIPELDRLPKEEQFKIIKIPSQDESRPRVAIKRGRVRCKNFPLVIMTSNGEREFPPAFMRRCLRLNMELPDEKQLQEIVEAHLGDVDTEKAEALITEFVKRRNEKQQELAADQLLNAVYLAVKNIDPLQREREDLLNALWKSLSEIE